MKHMITFLILILFTLRLFAPVIQGEIIIQEKPIQPFEQLWKAVCMVESSINPNAYHWEENGCVSVGIAQIQQSRVKDYNERTGFNYDLHDMYDITISKKIFMYYASDYSPYHIERIAREWNGGPRGMKYKQTLVYWNKVKRYLIN